MINALEGQLDVQKLDHVSFFLQFNRQISLIAFILNHLFPTFIVRMKSSIYISSQQSPKVFWWLKLLLLALVGYVLYDQIILNQDMATIQYQLNKGLKGSSWVYLVGCILLMPINWLLESVKWRMLILPWRNITKIDAMKAFLGIFRITFLNTEPNFHELKF